MHDYLESVETSYIAFCRRALPFAVEFFLRAFCDADGNFFVPEVYFTGVLPRYF